MEANSSMMTSRLLLVLLCVAMTTRLVATYQNRVMRRDMDALHAQGLEHEHPAGKPSRLIETLKQLASKINSEMTSQDENLQSMDEKRSDKKSHYDDYGIGGGWFG